MKISDLVKSPLNKRSQYPEEMIDDLAESIKQDGLLSKLVLRKAEGQPGCFEVLAGWRRRLALVVLNGEDYELPDHSYIVKDVDDYAAIRLYLTENVQRVNLSSLELAEGALALKKHSPKISTKEIAKILWITEARVKRLLDMNERLEELPENALRELGIPDEMTPAFTDAHLDAMVKAGAFDLPEDKIKDVCEMIIANDVPASKVKTVVDKMTPKDDVAPPEPEKKEMEDAGKMQDTFKGVVTMDEHGVITVESRKDTKQLDLTYYENFIREDRKFRVFLNAKITIKPVSQEEEG